MELVVWRDDMDIDMDIRDIYIWIIAIFLDLMG